MSTRKTKSVRKAARAKGGSRKKAGRKKAARKKTSRRKAARGTVARNKGGRRGGPRPRPQAVQTLPRKYDRYFHEVYGRFDDEALRTINRCCRAVREIPDDDGMRGTPGIGEKFAELTAALRDARPDLGITDEEIETIRRWPAEQLRTLRAAFLEIFHPPEQCPRPKSARFRGYYRPGSKSIGFKTGNGAVDVTFTGP